MRRSVLGLALWWCASIAPAHAATLLAGPGGTPAALADVLARAQDGDVIELLPGTYKGEVAVLPAKRLTLRGMGTRPVFQADGKTADGKGIWVVRGGDITVQNIEFRGARAADADGAGIRHEGGTLRVLDSAFYDNEHGIFSAHADTAVLTIERSIFAQAPKVVGGLSHLLSVGRIAKLEVTGSRFHQGFEGHMVKSRARETRIAYNLIHDGAGGESSYEIDLPHGGQAWIVGNVIGQSSRTQNPVVVAFGSEGRAWDKSALYLSHNTLVNDSWIPAWFLRVFRDRLPEGAPVHAVNNLVVGPGLFALGASADFQGNASALTSTLADVETMAFELGAGSWLRDRGVDPRNVAGQDLSPKAEFTMPIGTRAIPARTRWTPGAFQK